MGPFDRQFNAITGLNGSGKSNVLDGICFVLGITNLSKVRAGNLSELVYKQGQAGITKASVTIVFNNSDKTPGRSPVGFESQDVITVCRQIVIGGRNRYLVNGKTAQLQEVYNLFHSVQLNINNPHFLIMQGSITKVINMKPQEILGMIEEAAGTSMYESKKNLAIRTLEKKDVKVEEIDRIIKEEIEPQLSKLKGEKKSFLEWSSLVDETNQIEKTVASWQYRSALERMDGPKFEETRAELTKLRESETAQKKSVSKAEEKLNSDLKSLEKQRGLHETNVAEIEEAVQAGKRSLTETETNLKAKETTLKQTFGKQGKGKSTESKLAKLIDTKTAALAAAIAAFESAQSRLAATDADVDQKQKAVADLNAGTSGTGGDMSLQQCLNEEKSKLESHVTSLKSSGIKLKGLVSRLKDLKSRKSVSSNSSEFESLKKQRDLILEKISEYEKKLPNFNPNRFSEIGELIKTNERRIENLVEERNSINGTISQRLEFYFDPNSAQIDPKQVLGLVAKLVQIKPEFGDKYLLALELIAGAKLFNVVVDSEATYKKLLQSGKLRRRVTILPLDRIQGRRVSSLQLSEAKLAGGEAVPAIDAVAYAEQVRVALEYVFGTAFLVDSSEVGRKVTFNPNLADSLKCKSVTQDGDVFDPKGSLTGGSMDAGRNGRILASIYALQTVSFELGTLQAQTAELQGERSRMASSKDLFERIQKDLNQAQHALRLVQSKLQSTSQSQLVEEISALQEEIRFEENRASELEKEKAEIAAKVAAITKELKDMVSNKESRLKEITALVSSLKTEKKMLAKQVQETEISVQTAQVDLQSVQAELSSFREDLDSQSTICQTLEKEIQGLDETAQQKRDEIEALVAKLKEAKITKNSFEKTMKELIQQVETEKNDLEKVRENVLKIESVLKSMAKAREEARGEISNMERDFTWLKKDEILSDKSLEKKSESEISALKSRLEELKDDVTIKGKSINRRIIPLIERSEKEADDLLVKRANLEQEKKLIHEFIEELDDKKGRALSKTWQIVNSNFGSIFRSLLPKVDAKLAPPEGLTALEGLELKVQLGSVWKDSLTELSGGQKSLLALSLVLALLLFKPAPFYILDEVDAALDVSHTRNIGKMIKQYFPHSQFVIVSLKDGMFSNANVLFKVRFENGTSVIDRNEQVHGVDHNSGGVTIEFKENVYIEENTKIKKIPNVQDKISKKTAPKSSPSESSRPIRKTKTQAPLSDSDVSPPSSSDSEVVVAPRKRKIRN